MTQPETKLPQHLDFDFIRYINNIPLAVHCLQLELKCDYETANKFAEWHFKHMQHMFSVILTDSRFNDVHRENFELKQRVDNLQKDLSNTKENQLKIKETVIPQKVKKSLWRFWRKETDGGA